MTDLDDAKAQLQTRLAGLRILEEKAEEAQAEAQQEVEKAAAAKASPMPPRRRSTNWSWRAVQRCGMRAIASPRSASSTTS